MNGRQLLAWNLRRLRADRGLSQEKLAADSGIDRAYLSELERELGNASVDLVDRLAEALGVRPGALFVDPEPGSARPKPLTAGRKRKTQT